MIAPISTIVNFANRVTTPYDLLQDPMVGRAVNESKYTRPSAFWESVSDSGIHNVHMSRRMM